MCEHKQLEFSRQLCLVFSDEFLRRSLTTRILKKLLQTCRQGFDVYIMQQVETIKRYQHIRPFPYFDPNAKGKKKFSKH